MGNKYDSMSGQTEKRVLKDDSQKGIITDVLGLKTDAEADADLTKPWGPIALLKGILAKLRAGLTVSLSGSNVVSAISVTPNDTANITVTKGVYIGGTGNLKVDMPDGTTVTMTALASGMWHPIAVKRIYATGTTATSILAGY